MKASLVAVLPSTNSKYDGEMGSKGRTPLMDVIAAHTCMKPDEIALGPKPWVRFIHPEGNPYYFHPQWNIVTPDDVQVHAVAKSLEDAYVNVLEHLQQLDGTSVEIYLHICNLSGSSNTIEYYLADKTRRQIFWLEDVNVRRLGLEPYETQTFLYSALFVEYWTHRDYFPNHSASDTKAEAALLAILRYGSIDDSTSPSSTFQWSAEEASKLLSYLEKMAAEPDMEDIRGYRVAAFARIWSGVARVRHINKYGMPGARLDRFQGALEYKMNQDKPSALMSLGECLVLFASRQIFHRLLLLWNGRLVYQRHWQVLFKDMRNEWTRLAGVSGLIVLGDVLLISNGKTNGPIVASASFGSVASGLAIYFVQSHPKVGMTTAPEISDYIVQVEDYWHGLRPLSLTWALPRALAAYAAVAMQTGISLLLVEKATDDRSALLLVASWITPLLATCLFLFAFGALART